MSLAQVYHCCQKLKLKKAFPWVYGHYINGPASDSTSIKAIDSICGQKCGKDGLVTLNWKA
ncbi:MAG: hypothetical protein COT13_05420 [Chloroflexi bacterium CG08_land_8_20_14_0_20_45_12]|nr:MAG: hypothetical protein COT13_05420 [Chloroflexi bacterium CG08_land_8_20_14_0_20_45_12]PIX27370.1 MAG: hypothetical protein COZ67_02635 [Chloroflexi bacterium CG_4_8_14_3_um_filter_45_15]